MLATAELIHEAAQADKLAAVLPKYLKAPLYSEAWGYATPQNVPFVRSDLTRLPFITKQDIQHGFPVNFLGTGTDVDMLVESEAVELEYTSGTSETRTPLLLPRHWWVEQEKRALELNLHVARVLAKHPDARRVNLSSPACSSEICYTGVPSHDERVVGNTLFLSLSRFPFLWSNSELNRMVEEAMDWQPRFLDVDPVYGVVFALFCERHGIRLPSLSFILCSYEFVSVVHRRILERAFGVPVFDLYGSTETGHLLMEDASGEMRPSLETALLEVVDAAPDGIGELAVTTLTNDFMPLIRYRIGDLVGREEKPYGTRYVLHGRKVDAFLNSEGNLITTRHLDQCFVGTEGAAHYQVGKTSNGQWLLRIVPDREGPKPDAIAELHARIARLVQPEGDLKVELTDLLMPELSGKFRLGYPPPTK
jgi:phenylacetate-CoA ligase